MKRILILLSVACTLLACHPGEVAIRTSSGTLILTPLADNAVRVRMKGAPTHAVEELIFTEKVEHPRFSRKEDAATLTLGLKDIQVVYDKQTESLSYYDRDGKLLVQEQPGSRLLEKSMISGAPIPAKSTNGAALPQPDPIRDEPTYIARQGFIMQDGDHLFGTGQFQDGGFDLMGLTRRLTQNNTQIASPMVISSKGYGILWHNYGRTDLNPASSAVTLEPLPAAPAAGRRMPAPRTYRGELPVEQSGRYCLHLDVGDHPARGGHKIWLDGQLIYEDTNSWVPTVSVFAELSKGQHCIEAQGSTDPTVSLSWRAVDNTTTFLSPVAQNLDYAVFVGNADKVISTYRDLTGPVPPMPDWAFGFIQCRERYDTQAEVLENARGFVERDIPVSVIVQDWKWWGDTGWNSMVFDKTKYPDPAGMVRELHAMDMKFMISVWSRVESGTALGDSLARKGYFIPGTEWVDYFNPAAARYYWERFRESMVELGIDAWWFDATEPDNDYELLHRRVADNTIPGEVYRNVYPLVVNRAMYEGFRERDPEHMPVVLTRSAFAGAQRYGIITWSGDVNGDWLTLRRQITGGLGQMAAGLPWWTYDAGGFNRPANQYTDPAYQECMLRWIETSVFLPFMRVHGMSSRTEPWNYSPETQRIYVNCIRLRYQLMPYILDCAKRVSNEGYTLMRPLVFDFPDDREALRQDCEYMFGPDYLVCPVTQPGVSKWKVYLPENQAGWEDFRDGTHYDGGQYVCVPVNLEMIPVFKRL